MSKRDGIPRRLSFKQHIQADKKVVYVLRKALNVSDMEIGKHYTHIEMKKFWSDPKIDVVVK